MHHMKAKHAAFVACFMFAAGHAGAHDYILPDFMVSAQKENPYRTGAISDATLTLTPLIELPQSVELISDTLIAERGAGSLYEALESASGIFYGGDTVMSRTTGQYTMRGFSGSDVLLNGFSMPRTMGRFLDTSGIQQISVFRGPIGSIEGGQNTSLGAYGAGGNINVVTKRPLKERDRRVELAVKGGEGERVRSVLDLNEPLDEQGAFLLRVPGALEARRPFWLPSDCDAGYGLFTASSLLWQTDQAELRLDSMAQYDDSAAYQGIPLLQGSIASDYDAYFGNDDTRTRYSGAALQLSGVVKASRALRVHAALNWARADVDYKLWGVRTGAPAGMNVKEYYDWMAESGRGYGEYAEGDNAYENMGLSSYLAGLLDTGPVSHEWVAGGDFQRQQTDGESAYQQSNGLIDLHQPRMAGVPDVKPVASDSSVDRLGLFAQEQVAWNRLRALAGVRCDRHTSDQDNDALSWSPRLGLTWMLLPNLALYANLSRTEAPNFGYNDENGDELTDSWRADQAETGLKMDVFKDVWATFTLFQIRQENTPLLLPDSQTAYYSDGQTVSDGLEMSLAGRFTQSWSLQGSYTHIRYEDRQASMNFDRFPPHSVSIWSTYELPDGPLAGLKGGLGFRYAHEYMATFRGSYIGDDYTVPSYQVWDVLLEYPLRRFVPGFLDARVSFRINNLLDEEYISSIRHAPQAFPGEPRSFELALSTHF